MQNFQAGDYLIFQIESGFGLMRILGIERDENGENNWHLSAFNELFLDVEFADMAIENPASLTISHPHLVITQRAFEATQTARMLNIPLTDDEVAAFNVWQANLNRQISDRSVRLLLGLR